MAVSVDTRTTFAPNAPTVLFDGVYNLRSDTGVSYAVHPKGDRFLDGPPHARERRVHDDRRDELVRRASAALRLQRLDDRLRLVRGDDQPIPRGEIAVAHIDVRIGDALEHARRRAGLVSHRHQRDLLLLMTRRNPAAAEAPTAEKLSAAPRGPRLRSVV